MRRYLTQQQTLPPADAVRIEELVNYFDYADPPPTAFDPHPFTVRVETASCPWNVDARLVRIGLKGKVIPPAERPAANLVFLVDVSGSMNGPNRLPLVAESLRLLVGQLAGRDQVAIVVYAGAAGLVLPTTSCDRKERILDAIERLQAGGSTNGGAGIELAYAVAAQGFIPGGANRVVLCTDGDFNVGVSSHDALIRLIEAKAKQRVFLTVLGFGMGNLKDGTLEQLADKGNGNYGYVDGIDEARKLFVDELSGTLVAIAKDLKVQVEMNPARVQRYRLIGYENRRLAARDFNDDKKDAGEIGAGHTVTALYEVIPTVHQPGVDPPRYQRAPVAEGLTPVAASDELLHVKLRYKRPEGDVSALLAVAGTDDGRAFERASDDLRFAAGVTAFAMVLRGSQNRGSATLELAKRIAEGSLGQDAKGHRRELVGLIEAAQSLGAR